MTDKMVLKVARKVLPKAVREFAAGNLSLLAQRFEGAGFTLALPAPGILHIKAAGPAGRASVVLSAGVHGDETAPIELLALLLEELTARELKVDLMLCVGNLAAIAAGKRFIDADLNRMFRAKRGALAHAVEAERADAISAATLAFFNGAGALRWHFDLHTAIRTSLFSTFAIVPELIAPDGKQALFQWLGQGGIGAMVMNAHASGTYATFSALNCGAMAATVELGRVAALGQNDLGQFDGARLALLDLLRGGQPQAASNAVNVAPQRFRVVQEIIKMSDDFRFAFDAGTPNFSVLPKGALIASDGAARHTVGPEPELVLFPNPDVKIGLRAALMVAPLAAGE